MDDGDLDLGEGQSSEVGATFQCEHEGCHKVFKKRSHLKRHAVSHNSGSAFTCPTCQRGFNRSDSLARHLPLHSNTVSRTLYRAACSACSSVKTRCEMAGGEAPCARCKAKGLQCIVPSAADRQAAASGKAVGGKKVEKTQSPGDTGRHGDVALQRLTAVLAASSNDWAVQPPMPTNLPPIPRDPSSSHLAGAGALAEMNATQYLLPRRGAEANSALSSAYQAPPFQYAPMPSTSTSQQPQSSAIPYRREMPPVFDPQPQPQDESIMTFATPRWAEGIDSILNQPLGYVSDLSIWSSFMADDPFSSLPTYGASPVNHPSAASTASPMIDPFITGESQRGAINHPSTSTLASNATGFSNGGTVLTIHAHSRAPSPSQQFWIETKLPSNDPGSLAAMTSKGYQTALHEQEASRGRRLRVGGLTEVGLAHLREGLGELRDNPLHSMVPTSLFASKDLLDGWLQLFFENFNTRYPIMHRISFDSSKAHWLLLAAVIGVGARSSKASLAAEYARAINDVVRRGIVYYSEKGDELRSSYEYTTAILLFCIHAIFSGDVRQFEAAENLRAQLITTGRRLKVFQARPMKPVFGGASNDDDLWQEWIAREAKIRLGHGIINLESYLAVFFDIPPCLSSSELHGFFPCRMHIWEAESSEHWRALLAIEHDTRTVTNPLIFSVLHQAMSGQAQHVGLDTLQRQSLLLILGRILLERHKVSYSAALYCNPTDSNGSLAVPLDSVFSITPDCAAVLDAITHTGVFSAPATQDHGTFEKSIAHYISLQQLVPLFLVRIMAGKTTGAATRQEAEQALRTWARSDEASRRIRKAAWHAAQIYDQMVLFSLDGPDALALSFDACLVLWTFCQLESSKYVSSGSHDFALDTARSLVDAQPWFDDRARPGAITGVGRLADQAGKENVLNAFKKLLAAKFPNWAFSRWLIQILEELSLRQS